MKPSRFLLNFLLFVFVPAIVLAAVTDYFSMTGNYKMVSDYGPRSVGGSASSCHGGLDLQKSGRTPYAQFSMNSGVVNVINTGCAPGSGNLNNRCGGGYGNYLTVTSECGLFRTLYGHADSLNVSSGQQVDAGKTQIATYNSQTGTGTSSGLHTHFETHVKVGGQWRKIDPQLIEKMIFEEGKNPCNSGFAEEALQRSRGLAGKECMRAKDTSAIQDAGVPVSAQMGASVNQVKNADTGNIAAYNPGTSTVADNGKTGTSTLVQDELGSAAGNYDSSTCNSAVMSAGNYNQAAGLGMAMLENMAKNFIIPSLINQLACPDKMISQSQSVMKTFSDLGASGGLLGGLGSAFGQAMSGIASSLGVSLSSLSSIANIAVTGLGIANNLGLVKIGGGMGPILGALSGAMSGSCGSRNMSIFQSLANPNQFFASGMINNLTGGTIKTTP